MKRFLRDLFLFIPFAITIYIIAVCVIGDLSPIHTNLNYEKGAYGHMHTRVREARSVKDVDILFLGSSLSYRGFDVRYYQNLGFNVFNLGSSSQSPIQTKLLLDRYIDSLNPKHIIYEIHASRLASDGVESSIDIISNDSNDWYSVVMASKIKHIKTLNTLIYGFYKDLFFSNSYEEQLVRGIDTYIQGGFVSKELNFYKNDQVFETIDYSWKEYQLTALNQIIDLAKNRDIRLTFVHTPVNSNMNHYPNKFDDYMKSLGEYINFNPILDLDDSLDFYDPRHLNQNGVEKFNLAVIDVLKIKKVK